MLRSGLACTIALTIALGLPALAHHGVDHGAPVVPTVPVIETSPVVFAPPPVVVPVPVLTPPVIAPLPPPMVQAPLPVLPTISFQLPVIAPPNTILPTDVSGIHSGPDASAFQKIPGAAPMTKEALAALTAPDSRYQFTGKWMPFSAEYSASALEESPYKPVALESSETKSFKVGKIEKIEKQPTKTSEPAFMPTTNASYSKVNDEHLALHSGAVLVRAGDRPVTVSTNVKRQTVQTKVANGALAMISAFDEKATVLSLTDKCCGALMLYVPTLGSENRHVVSVKPGQVAEIYAPTDTPSSNLVATKVDVNQRIVRDYGLLVSQCHYIRALKKYNLVAALDKNDMNRVLKTAAAIAHVRR